ncbi:MAG: hypothetical protein JWP59_4486 [Massilia sp.]|nr:hypothetical protein [Massilia sp.]
MKHIARSALAAAAFAFFANAAQAAPVQLDWTTTVSYSETSGLSTGDSVKMTFEFNPESGNLNNARLNASNFVSYSFTLSDGRSATLDMTDPGSFLGYTSNDYFVFDAAGHL